MSGETLVVARKTEKCPQDAFSYTIGAVFAVAGIGGAAFTGANGVTFPAVWVLIAILIAAGLAFLGYAIYGAVRYSRTPESVIEGRDGKLFILGEEVEAEKVSDLTLREERTRKGEPKGWGAIVVHLGERKIVCRYIEEVRGAYVRAAKYIVSLQGGGNV